MKVLGNVFLLLGRRTYDGKTGGGRDEKSPSPLSFLHLAERNTSALPLPLERSIHLGNNENLLNRQTWQRDTLCPTLPITTFGIVGRTKTAAASLDSFPFLCFLGGRGFLTP